MEPIKKSKDDLRRLLQSTVNSQLISDVPVGLFLSGGIDSSAIAASIGQKSGRRLNSFAAEFDFSGNKSELKKLFQIHNKV